MNASDDQAQGLKSILDTDTSDEKQHTHVGMEDDGQEELLLQLRHTDIELDSRARNYSSTLNAGTRVCRQVVNAFIEHSIANGKERTLGHIRSHLRTLKHQMYQTLLSEYGPNSNRTGDSTIKDIASEVAALQGPDGLEFYTSLTHRTQKNVITWQATRGGKYRATDEAFVEYIIQKWRDKAKYASKKKRDARKAQARASAKRSLPCGKPVPFSDEFLFIEGAQNTSTDKHQLLQDNIAALTMLEGCLAIYDSVAFKRVVANLRGAQFNMKSVLANEKHVASTLSPREEWSKRWAITLHSNPLHRQARAYDRDRTTLCSWLFRVCDLAFRTPKENSHEVPQLKFPGQLRKIIKFRRLLEVLYLVVPMDRANAMYNIMDPKTMKRIGYWSGPHHSHGQLKLQDPRYRWLSHLLDEDDILFDWLRPAYYDKNSSNHEQYVTEPIERL